MYRDNRKEQSNKWGDKAHLGIWLGWAYLTKTVRKAQRGGVNFDPPMIFCACSMQNAPAASEMLPMSSYLV